MMGYKDPVEHKIHTCLTHNSGIQRLSTQKDAPKVKKNALPIYGRVWNYPRTVTLVFFFFLLELAKLRQLSTRCSRLSGPAVNI